MAAIITAKIILKSPNQGQPLTAAWSTCIRRGSPPQSHDSGRSSGSGSGSNLKAVAEPVAVAAISWQWPLCLGSSIGRDLTAMAR
jgi:hypothetical protein